MLITSRLKKSLCGLLEDRKGTIMVAFAVMLPVLISSVGMSLDMAGGYLVRTRLAGALDASALAAAASETDEIAIRERVEEFFAANYPEEKIGVPYNLEVSVIGDDVIVSAYADYSTSFMRVVGIDHLTVFRETVIRRDVQGLEVALVLDNTGSMSSNNNIGALREATTNFINILFERVDDPESIRIGLVPYANAVRVGSYGLGLNPDGSTYYDPDGDTDPDPFVELPAGLSYTTNHNSSTGWYGCVIEYNEAGWDVNITDNDPYPNDVLDQEYDGPWEPYMYQTYGSNAVCGTYIDSRGRVRNNSCYYQSSVPNNNCPYAMVTPLSSDQDALLAAVGTMQAHGMTLGNIGMAWGARVLSPEPPFVEGHDWDDPHWRKAIIIMTDGDNTRDRDYSAFWRNRNNQLTVTDYNERFVESCDALKDNGVLVYSITFTSAINDDTKQYYEDCATSPAQYYDAPTQAELLEVFDTISHELANLHITQ